MRLQRNRSFLLLAGIVFAISCTEALKEGSERSQVKNSYELKIPSHFPKLEIPSDNYLSNERVDLGKKLFFDKRLSLDSTVNCESCHKPSLAFADSVAVSPGINGKKGFRNAPSLLNIAFRSSFMLDGGVPTLEIQVVHPLTDTNEMGFGINEAVNRLKDDPIYKKMAKQTYHREFDAFVLTRALSAYERTLISRTSFDDFAEGKSNLNAQASRGRDLFFSEKLNCTSCHSGALFSDFSFQNNGSKENYQGDNGRERITHKESDIGKFKVTSLRAVGITAPYMHDGSFKTLDEVIDHYSKGGSNHPNKSEKVRAFTLTNDEKNDLIQFLKSL